MKGNCVFTQLYDKEDKVTVGEQVVTSNISEKYVEGLFIGYVSDIQLGYQQSDKDQEQSLHL